MNKPQLTPSRETFPPLRLNLRARIDLGRSARCQFIQPGVVYLKVYERALFSFCHYRGLFKAPTLCLGRASVF